MKDPIAKRKARMNTHPTVTPIIMIENEPVQEISLDVCH
jgi:hypothetical protein